MKRNIIIHHIMKSNKIQTTTAVVNITNAMVQHLIIGRETYVAYVDNCPSLTKIDIMPGVTQLTIINCKGLHGVFHAKGLSILSITKCPNIRAVVYTDETMIMSDMKRINVPGLDSNEKIHVYDLSVVDHLPIQYKNKLII